MAKELLIRKQKGTHSPQCTSYRIVEPAWRFTLETCDEDVTGVIKDDVGNTIATVSAGAPAIVSRLGSYNVCVTGNGMGSLYVEWTDDTYVDQQCCNEVRKEFEQMLDDAIANVESKIPSATVTVRGGENTEVTKSGNTYTVNATDTVTTLKAGNGISLQRNGYEYTVSSKVANVVAGENVSIQEGTESDGSPRFEISAVDTKPDVDKAYVDAAIAAIVDKDTVTTMVAGNQNVTIIDSGTGGNHAYTISTVDTKPDVTKAYVDQQVAAVPRPDVTKAYVDEQIAAIEDNNTVTTLVAANGNVTIVDSGTDGNHVYNVSTKDTVTTIVAGENISVTKSGNEYTVSSTGGSSGTTELVAGNNVSISDAGTGGNHRYTVNATDTVTTVKQGTNTTVTKNGNEYTVNATDTVTTVKAGNNVSVSKSGNEYTVNATDTVTTVVAGANVTVSKNGNEYTVSSIGGSGTDTVTTLTAGNNNITITDNGTDGNHAYTISTVDTNTVTTVSAGTGIGIVDNGTGGNHAYTITATGSVVTPTTVSAGDNIKVTKVNDDYNVSLNNPVTIGDNTSTLTYLNEYSISIDKYTGTKSNIRAVSDHVRIYDNFNSNTNYYDNYVLFNASGIRYSGNVSENSHSNEILYLNITMNNIDFAQNNGSLTGLSNKTWTDGSFTSGRAATEDQLNALAARIAALEARL